MNKPIQRVWTFCSDSDPEKDYQTLQYHDGSTSCNCAGWTRRVAADGTRSCKHTRMVDMGTADRRCTATRDYATAKPVPATRTLLPTPKLGHRKFAV